jgi:hypothetical protein
VTGGKRLPPACPAGFGRMIGASLCADWVFRSQYTAAKQGHRPMPRSREPTNVDRRCPDFGFRLPCRRFAMAVGSLCAPRLVRRRCRLGRISRGCRPSAVSCCGSGGGNSGPRYRPLGIRRNQITLAPHWHRAGVRRACRHRGLPCCAWYSRSLWRCGLECGDSIDACSRDNGRRSLGRHLAAAQPILTK